MNLAQKLEEVKKPRPTPLDVWVAGLDDVDRKALLVAASDPEIATIALFRILQDAGLRIGKETLTEWRRGHGLTR